MTKAIDTTFAKSKKLSLSDYSVSYYRSVHHLSTAWEMAQPSNDLFLQREYLQIVEEYPPKGMEFCYFIFFKSKRPVGVAACQIQFFDLEQSMKDDNEVSSPCFFLAFGKYLKGFVANKVEFTTLVCGNLLLTGEHGFYFDRTKVTYSESMQILNEALSYGLEELNKEGKKVSTLLIKEFYEKDSKLSGTLVNQAYKEFSVEPNMVMDIPNHWNSFDDYLGAMYAKYRTRAKRAFKKSVKIERRELDELAIQENLPLLHKLYSQVAENSGFNLISLNENYLLALKKNLGDRFKLMGYYYEGKLIAFYTAIWNGSEMEAHFLGFEKKYNPELQVYLNILYDLIKIAIDGNADKLIFARTALEIKSSVGAVAHEMHCYFRHRNSFSNRFLNPLLDYLKPDKEWKPRHPFKEDLA